MKKATIYRVDGTTEKISPENGKHFELHELYRLIGCEMIEMVSLNDNEIMIVDEEGKVYEKAINNNATRIYHDNLGPYDIIVGDALVCDASLFM